MSNHTPVGHEILREHTLSSLHCFVEGCSSSERGGGGGGRGAKNDMIGELLLQAAW